MSTRLVSILLLGLSRVCFSWRPTDTDASPSSYEVSLTPGGTGRARKASGADSKEATANASQAQHNVSTLHDAFHDHSRPMPRHLLEERLEESLLEEADESLHKNLFHKTAFVGQVLRGVLDFHGYAFALHMDRQAWKKYWSKKDQLWKAQGLLYVKLLRYPLDPEEQKTKGRKFKPVDFQAIGGAGWIGHVVLKGWWDDQTLHFRGKTVIDKKEQADWLQHAMLPWREADMRFDENGCHTRFDWKLDQGMLRDFFKGKDTSWGVFRLDNMPSEGLQTTFDSMTFTRNVLSQMTLRMQDFKATEDKNSSAFTGILEQRPISMVNQDMMKEEPGTLANGRYGSKVGGGEWFTFIGTRGQLELEFKKDSSGRMYEATPKGTSCGMLKPCPWIVQESYDVQFFDSYAVFKQKNPDAGKDGRSTYMFYPIFDDEKMHTAPDALAAQAQGLDTRLQTNEPVVQKPVPVAVGQVTTPVEDVEEDEPYPSKREKKKVDEREEQPYPLKRESKKVDEREEPLPPVRSEKDQKIMKRQGAKINELTEQVTDLKDEVETLKQKVKKKGDGQKDVKVNPGQSIVVTAENEDQDEYPRNATEDDD